MKHRFSRTALLASLIVSGTSTAATTTAVDLEKAAGQATMIETRHADGPHRGNDLFTTSYYLGGTILMSWNDDQRVLLLCKDAAYLDLPGMKPAASDLPLEKRSLVAYHAMLATFGGVSAIGGLVDGRLTVAEDGSEVRRQAERRWAYGIERYDVITQRMPGGALRVRALKTATVNNATPSKPGDSFSSDEDQAARLAELGAVGSWTEITIYDTPARGNVHPNLSLKDWVSVKGDNAATVGEARRINGCE
ncbi:hypothetical protein FJU31_06140 [Stenotrophomonas cyclobalanopsidis]|uniref:Uncharacterized protein n=1 Tax=Stenotrophomonas cyclobalanopsidis TaxID=2771362 RepID=A0ABQ6T304_9GAMM|nr:hypothetical protein [Stenotrophomonas cyclobalanopsidis]KAA9001531.1 hypothetical protein FJU31_06140 [Stenotrophomonas cyclobalanopsidis]